jgi:hypothetical protein
MAHNAWKSSGTTFAVVGLIWRSNNVIRKSGKSTSLEKQRVYL